MQTGQNRPKRPVRMLEVAAAAGVSRSTVSNVMRGLESVAEPVRLRVLQHADELGYIYNRGAASLRSSQSQLIGLIVPHIANPFIAEVIRGAHEVLSRRGYLVTTIETEEDPARQSTALRSFAEHRVDGFILLPAIGTDEPRLLESLHGLPVVVLNRDPHLEDVDFVAPDDATVVQLAADHLLVDHACSRVAYFGGVAEATPRRTRAAMFAARVESAGDLLVEEWSVPSSPTSASAYALAKELLTTDVPPPEGVFCHSDEIAYGVLRALSEAGISRQQCRVIGCDDLPDSAFWNPSLTSVSVQPAEVGRIAAQRLLTRIGEPMQPESLPSPQLTLRESCGCE